ncbi:helix-turn-helix domain-containing protein, partial [Streptomyces boncukensis]|nr:helix-turn-helix transcriptional regulator [Streptomyces boncukensis]
MHRNPNTRLRHLMEEAGWSQAQLAAAVAAVAAERGMRLGCDRSSVSRWLSGTVPRP